jgi:hypothetical protein
MMRSKTKVVVVSVALLATATVRVSAHHSFGAVFDATKPVTLTGTVTRVEMMNPHGWIHIDVKQPDGTVKNWVIETNTPQQLAARGLKKNSIPIGLELVVQGYRAKDGSNTANGTIIRFPDGRDFAIGSLSGDAANDKPSGGAPPY